MKGKVVKAVVHMDYHGRGDLFHKVKSFGIVNREDMKSHIFKKIK